MKVGDLVKCSGDSLASALMPSELMGIIVSIFYDWNCDEHAEVFVLGLEPCRQPCIIYLADLVKIS